jgi:ribosomal protein L35
MRAHKLEKKPGKQKRKFGRDVELAGSDVRSLKQMLRIK